MESNIIILIRELRLTLLAFGEICLHLSASFVFLVLAWAIYKVVN